MVAQSYIPFTPLRRPPKLVFSHELQHSPMAYSPCMMHTDTVACQVIELTPSQVHSMVVRLLTIASLQLDSLADQLCRPTELVCLYARNLSGADDPSIYSRHPHELGHWYDPYHPASAGSPIVTNSIVSTHQAIVRSVSMGVQAHNKALSCKVNASKPQLGRTQIVTLMWPDYAADEDNCFPIISPFDGRTHELLSPLAQLDPLENPPHHPCELKHSCELRYSAVVGLPITTGPFGLVGQVIEPMTSPGQPAALSCSTLESASWHVLYRPVATCTPTTTSFIDLTHCAIKLASSHDQSDSPVAPERRLPRLARLNGPYRSTAIHPLIPIHVIGSACQSFQVEGQLIILTGEPALNKGPSQETYTSDLWLGGTQIVHKNGNSHWLESSNSERTTKISMQFGYDPKVKGGHLPITSPIDGWNRERTSPPVQSDSPADPLHSPLELASWLALHRPAAAHSLTTEQFINSVCRTVEIASSHEWSNPPPPIARHSPGMMHHAAGPAPSYVRSDPPAVVTYYFLQQECLPGSVVVCTSFAMSTASSARRRVNVSLHDQLDLPVGHPPESACVLVCHVFGPLPSLGLLDILAAYSRHPHKRGHSLSPHRSVSAGSLIATNPTGTTCRMITRPTFTGTQALNKVPICNIYMTDPRLGGSRVMTLMWLGYVPDVKGGHLTIASPIDGWDSCSHMQKEPEYELKHTEPLLAQPPRSRLGLHKWIHTLSLCLEMHWCGNDYTLKEEPRVLKLKPNSHWTGFSTGYVIPFVPSLNRYAKQFRSSLRPPLQMVVPDYSKPDGLRAAWSCSDRRPISSMGHYRHNSTSPRAGKKTYVKTQPKGLQWCLFFRANRLFISAPSGTLVPIARSSYQPIPVVPMHSLKGSHRPINLKNPFPSQVTPATPASYCEKTGPSQPASKLAQSSRVLAHSPTVRSFAFLPGGPGGMKDPTWD
ncbi:uncharacterized protein EI90DRAFT_3199693 [Cantharellus anzutake]|uniref:uncharacterized protein n=1 Tax=Cantharellus anzutake TaxID=1750568 RepID=UPI001903243F|nr:uncharacterized protein EI90DRAFT_3199693 [Cantharellus anzutake]KAF8331044.1 hypothetical protein EI90DRAFT_3199693 [Cantharellus anzutake]